MNPQYLLENTPEAQEMRNKVKDLLLSRTEANAQLALQLLQGGGVPPEIMPYIWGLTYAGLDLRLASIEKLLKKHLNPTQTVLYNELKQLYIKRYEEYEWSDVDEAWADMALHRLEAEETTKPYFQDFALAFLIIARKGGKRLLRFQLLPEELIIQHLIQSDYLSLEHFDLVALPACVGKFTHLRHLNIRGNRIAHIPTSFAQLQNLLFLEFDATIDDFETPQTVLDTLAEYFPKVMAEYHQNEGWNWIELQKTEEGIAEFEKSVRLVLDNSRYWNNLAWAYSHAHQFEKAFEASDHAIALAENVTQKASYLSNKASDQQRAGFLTECEVSAKEVRTILGKTGEKHWKESDYFSFALATQILGKFEEALAYYERYENMFGAGSDGSLYYNKACIYARMGNREKMADMMRACVDNDNIDWISEMRHDLDFQAFWNDSIITELEQYAQDAKEKLPF